LNGANFYGIEWDGEVIMNGE